MAQKESLYVKCAERVALLELLGKTPALPSRNSRPPTERSSTGHTLAEDTERQLALELAMLSSIKHDPNQVTAVCVCEEPPGLTVLLAANAPESRDSSYMLEVQHGLERIFEILHEASYVSESDREKTKEKAFMAIISMCRKRIIKRARLGLIREKKRFPVFLKAVCETLNRSPKMKYKQAVQDSLKKLQLRMASCQEKIAKSTHNQANHDEQVAKIIENCFHLRTTPMWKDVIKSTEATKPPMNPSTTNAIVNMIEKLAQYKEAAITLTKIAWKKPILRRARVNLVRLSGEAYARDCISSTGEMKGPRELLVQFGATHGKMVDYGEILKRIEKTEDAAESHYRRTLDEHLRSARIHAEMQLVWYLDSNSSQTPPRFLASNKDACFLCNAFISSYRMYTIPRSHGRVYPGWRLPATGLENAQMEFIKDLEMTVVTRAREITDGVRRLAGPLESTVNSSIGSLSTALMAEHEIGGQGLVEEEEANGDSDSDPTVRSDSQDALGVIASRYDVALAADSDTDSEIEVKATTGLKDGLDAGSDSVSTGPARPVKLKNVAEDADSVAPTNFEHGIRLGLTTSQLQSRTSDRRYDIQRGPQSHGASDNPWQTRKVNPGGATKLRLSDQLHLHIEYSYSGGYNCTLDAATGSRGLSVRYRRLSAATVDVMRIPRDKVYDVRRDLLPSHDVACRANSRFVHLKAPDDTVFQIDLGCPA